MVIDRWRRRYGLPSLPDHDDDREVVPPLPPKPERVKVVEPEGLDTAWDVWDVARALANGDRATADRAFQHARKRKKENTP